ncbi:MAG TPA: AAA family ATPase [Limnochordia bacterium]
MPDDGNPPRTPEEVIDLFESGRVNPAQAFSLFRQLENGAPPRRPVAPPARPKGADDEAERQARLAEVLRELDGLIGLHSVKKLVREVHAFVDIQRRRAAQGLTTQPIVLHMIFKGNPGTGKTTVARIFGRMFKEMGVLPKGHLVEVERADLVGEYIGHTAQKTRDVIRRAMGGILFIDEAYSLARGGEKDFGKEAIDCLVKAMEDARSELVLILAGYRREMDDFLRTNPGLRSRFPIHIEFNDYTPLELYRIAQGMFRQREYRLDPAARDKLMAILRGADRHLDAPFGNARWVRNLVERALRRQAVRLVGQQAITRQDLMLIRAEDIQEVPGD